MRAPLSALAAALLLVAAACDSPSSARPPETLTGFGPESVPRAFSPGDTIIGEEIDSETDVDEFSIIVPRGRLHMTLYASPGQVLSFAVVDSASRFTLQSYILSADSARSLFLGQGRRVFVRIEAVPGEPSRGAYRLATRFVSPYPESRDSVIAPGESVVDSIDTPDDVDEYVFQGTEGQEIAIQFEQSEPVNSMDYVLMLFGPHVLPDGDTLAVRTTGYFQPASAANRGIITRLPRTGTYRVHVRPEHPSAGSPNRYRFLLHPVNRAPESASPVLVHGVPAADAIEVPGDVDEFTFNAVEGEYFRIFIRREVSSRLEHQLVDGLTGEIVDRYVPASDPVPYGEGNIRVQAPRTGPYTVRLLSYSADTWGPYAGPYELTLYRFDAGPEDGAPDRIALGDTVGGEAIWPEGDVDTYEFTGTAGQQFTILGAVPSGARVDVVHAASGERLSRLTGFRTGPRLDRQSTVLATLPETGRYLVRVWHSGENDHPYLEEIGPYAFSIAPVSLLPERVPETVPLGVVVEESIDPVRDVDTYTFTATEGETFELWSEENDPVRGGSLRLGVKREGFGSLAGVFPGGAFPTKTFTVPFTGTWTLVAESPITSSDPTTRENEGQYAGGYRFRLRKIP